VFSSRCKKLPVALSIVLLYTQAISVFAAAPANKRPGAPPRVTQARKLAQNNANTNTSNNLRPGATSQQDNQILDNSGRGSLETPPALKGPLAPNTQGLPTPTQIKKPETAAAKAAAGKLDAIVDESIKSMGAMFVDPEQVIVKPPMLEALIRVEEKLSPYSLEASGNRNITLHDVLTEGLFKSLSIQLSKTDSDIRKWRMVSSFGSFLPTISNELTYQGITGNYISPASAALPIQNYYMTMPTGFSQYLYKGGGILHKYLEDRHEFKASKHAVVMDTNDSLQDIAKAYYSLAENEVLLQIRIKSVETAEALLLVNQDLYANGVDTLLEVLQAKTLLSRERQELIKQQIARREAAIKLSTMINEDAGVDLSLGNPQVVKTRLIDKSMNIKDLLQVALDNRPELKRYEELRLAAKDAVKVAKAPLLPQLQVIGSTIGTFARINNQSIQQQAQQQTTFSQSGGASAGSVSGGSSLPIASGSNSSSGRHDAGRSLFILGLDLQWNLGGLGLTSAAKVMEARSDVRRRQLQFLKELNKVYKEVRDAYLNCIQAENLIIETTDTVNSSREQLRVAKDRLTNGVGTNLDVINAERDYSRALVDKAKAIIEFNTNQCELMHDIGKISVSTLTPAAPLRF
jgi:outer membrane protein TolC